LAFLRISRRGQRRYYYVVESYRRSGTVRQKVLEYLGRDPDPARLRRALRYWKIGKGRGKARKGGR
jgi:hypothetical protein